MKFILVLLVSLGAFQAQAASRDEKALSVKNAGSRSYQLKITQYRLLWLAGELGYTPQNR